MNSRCAEHACFVVLHLPVGVDASGTSGVEGVQEDAVQGSGADNRSHAVLSQG